MECERCYLTNLNAPACSNVWTCWSQTALQAHPFVALSARTIEHCWRLRKVTLEPSACPRARFRPMRQVRLGRCRVETLLLRRIDYGMPWALICLGSFGWGGQLERRWTVSSAQRFRCYALFDGARRSIEPGQTSKRGVIEQASHVSQQLHAHIAWQNWPGQRDFDMRCGLRQAVGWSNSQFRVRRPPGWCPA